MTDFTGGVVESFALKDNHPGLFERMIKSSKRASLMSCSVAVNYQELLVTIMSLLLLQPQGRDDVEKKLDTGLVVGHAYSITGTAKVKDGLIDSQYK